MATYRKLPSGKWQARVFVNGKYKSIGTFDTKKEAEIKGNEADKNIYYGETIADREMTFSNLIEMWMEYKKLNVKGKTFKNISGIVNKHILPHFGNKKLYTIKRVDIMNWLKKCAQMKKEDGSFYSYGSRESYYYTLSDIFNFAVYELEILPSSPCVKLTIPNKKERKNKRKYYTLEELNGLLDYLKSHNPRKHKEYNLYYVLFYFLSRTGLRINEALALTWDDLNGNMLDINKQVHRDTKKKINQLDSLKTESSYREIKLDHETVELLKEFKRTQNKVILKYKTFVKSKENIIFQNNEGDYLNDSGVRDNLVIYCDNAGVDYKGTHVFRHTHAVLLLESGANLDYVSKRLGHKSIKVTADEYSDVTPKREDSELAKFTTYMARNRHEDKKEEV